MIVDNAKCNDAGNKAIGSTNIPQQYDDYVLTETVPLRDDTNLRRIAVEVVDKMEQEFSSRFASTNTLLWSAMESLSPSSETFLDVKCLEPFYIIRHSDTCYQTENDRRVIGNG